MRNSIISVFLLSIMAACSSGSIKEKINETGAATGEAIGEFSTGVSSGVEKALEVNLELNESLTSKGITFGKQTISNDPTGGEDNLLIVYLIFEKDFTGSMLAKVYDNKGQEMGRVKIDVQGKKDEAKFVEFHFDKRTNIDSDSKITIE